MMINKAVVFLVTAYFALNQNYVSGQTIHNPSKEGASDLISRQTSTRSVISDQRNDYCEISKQVQLGNMDMREALKGFHVSIGIGLQETDDKKQQEISLKVFDEIARRGQFYYKDSIGEVPPPTGNETYTDTLFDIVNNYDVAVEGWIRSATRTALGITGAVRWYDASTIMIRKKDSSTKGVNFEAVFDPFNMDIWLLIAATIIVSGVAYHFIDYMIHRGNPEAKDGIGGNLFKSTLAFMGDNSYDPKFAANRILLVSMSFLSLILVAAYTANLASFLVNKNSKQSIDTFDNVIGYKYGVCVYKGSYNTVSIQQKYPQAKYVEKESALELYQGLIKNECLIGLISEEEHNMYKNDEQYNTNCTLEVVGKPVRMDSASFALKSSDKYCSSILRDVLDIFLLEIIQDGTLESIKKNAYEGSQTCDSGNGEVDDARLSVRDLGGIFIIHYALIILVLIMTVLHIMCPNVVAKNIDKLAVCTAMSSCIANKMSCLFKSDKDKEHQYDENDIEANDAIYGASLNSIKHASTEHVIMQMYKEVLKLKYEMRSEISEMKTSQDKMVKSQAHMQRSQAHIFQRRPQRQVFHAVKSTQGEF